MTTARFEPLPLKNSTIVLYPLKIHENGLHLPHQEEVTQFGSNKLGLSCAKLRPA